MTDVEREQHDVEAELDNRLWAVLNDPEMQLARAPEKVARRLGAMLVKVLIVMAETKPESDVGFGLQLIAQIEGAFVQQTTPDTAPTRH